MATKRASSTDSAGMRTKSALLERVLRQVSTLSLDRQEAIATQILRTIQAETDPASERFQQLIEKKYTVGLSTEDTAELDRLETEFQRAEAAFYAPILERASRGTVASGKRRRTN